MKIVKHDTSRPPKFRIDDTIVHINDCDQLQTCKKYLIEDVWESGEEYQYLVLDDDGTYLESKSFVVLEKFIRRV